MMKKKNILLLFAVIGNAYAMDASIGVKIVAPGEKLTLQDTGFKATALLFNPKKNQLAIARGTKVDLHTFTNEGKIGEILLTFPHKHMVRDMSFDASGELLATCQWQSSHGDIYSTITPKRIGLINFCQEGPLNVHFHPTKPTLFCGYKSKIIICDVGDNEIKKNMEQISISLRNHEWYFNSTGERLIMREMKTRQLSSYKIESKIKDKNTIPYLCSCVCSDPAHNRLGLTIEGSNRIQIYDLDQDKKLCTFQYNCYPEDDHLIKIGGSPVESMNFNKIGKYLAVGFHTKNRFLVYDLELQKIIHEYKNESPNAVKNITFSPDGRFLILSLGCPMGMTMDSVSIVELPQA